MYIAAQEVRFVSSQGGGRSRCGRIKTLYVHEAILTNLEEPLDYYLADQVMKKVRKRFVQLTANVSSYDVTLKDDGVQIYQ
ncbi:hypothetical protein F8538_16140 [Edwardsiella ictaluri]|uniref:hypothetical protein n=1 Tax=Edwardsiella ictaluri TaxID=67780 RepID=UPI0018C8CC94|nr:hypothetical protein [Edwardsiella ictaluri]QPW25410.1 hypothetical protein F8538_16140 [Edwardsiella ictaluri]